MHNIIKIYNGIKIIFFKEFFVIRNKTLYYNKDYLIKDINNDNKNNNKKW